MVSEIPEVVSPDRQKRVYSVEKLRSRVLLENAKALKSL
jgi:hypothetical protein